MYHEIYLINDFKNKRFKPNHENIEPEKPQTIQNTVWGNFYYSLVTLYDGITTTVIADTIF